MTSILGLNFLIKIFTTPNIKCVFSLKIRLHSKQELFDKDFLESSDVILFVEYEHSLLVVDGVQRFGKEIGQ